MERHLMRRRIAIFVCLAAVLGLLSGCTGGGDTTFPAEFAGTYATDYTRSTGTMTIAVATNGQITLTIVDGIEGTFVGTGIANHVGGFFITCNGVNNKQVSVNGTLKGTGLGRTAQGTIAGTISVAYNAAFLHDPDVTVYTNHYEGVYKQGSVSGDWQGDVSTGGVFSGSLFVTVVGNTITVPLTGNVYSNGSFKFTGTTPGTKYEATGNFTLQAQGVICNGLIKGTSGALVQTGEFSGHNAIGG